MLIVCGFYPGDQDQAERLAGWLKEIGPFPGHRLIVARDVRTNATPFNDVGFDRVDDLVITGDVWNSWPQSANNVFRQVAIYVELVDKAPHWLWIEPDVVPLTRDAFDILEREYIEAGKPFMGDLVAVPGVEIHMSGVAIYPGQLTSYAGEAKLAVDLAWDMAAREQIVPQMHQTKRILHAWKHPAFEDWASVQREVFEIKPQCVLFHASKDGSLINLLRQQRNHEEQVLPTLPVTIRPERPEPKGDVSEREEVNGVSRGGQFISVDCDILIKSYPPDYDLLKYCLQSIYRFAHGFKNVVLVVPEGEWPTFVNKMKDLPANLNIVKVNEHGHGYLFQQVVKARAHAYTVSEYVLHIDSDTILTTDITPGDFFRDGKPIWFITPYGETCPDVPWRACTETFIKHPVAHEYMRRLPMFVPRKVHDAMSTFCIAQHGVTLDKWIIDSQHFSEFNALGAVAWELFRDDIYWFDTSAHPESEWPPLVALQTWSHGDRKETKKQFESILGTPWQVVQRHKKEEQISGAEMERPSPVTEPSSSSSLTNGKGEPATVVDSYHDIEHPRQKPVIPWENKLESELEIKRLVRELRAFQTSPRYVERVRTELKLARVVPGRKFIKGMAKRRRRLG